MACLKVISVAKENSAEDRMAVTPCDALGICY